MDERTLPAEITLEQTQILYGLIPQITIGVVL
jgi:hypothetical protein